MHPKFNPRRIAPVVLMLLALVAVVYWYFYLRPAKTVNGALSASGTLEIPQVQIGTELGGKVTEVHVDEGDRVRSGDILVQLDTALLQAGRDQAAAALQVAKANSYTAQSAVQQAEADLTVAEVHLELVESTEPARWEADITAATLALLQAQDALTELNQNAPLITAETQMAMVNAQDSIQDAQEELDTLISNWEDEEQIALWQANYLIAQRRVDRLQKTYDKIKGSPEYYVPKAKALSDLESAKSERDIALAHLNWYQNPVEALELAEKEANLALAQAQLEVARTEWDDVKDGSSLRDVKLIEEKIANAKALLDLANAKSAPQQIALAQAQLEAAKARNQAAQSQAASAETQVVVAQAALDALEVQIAKLTISAPSDGVVLSLIIQLGEIATPGSTLLILGQTDNKTITVYVPEDRYGQLSVGQAAEVSVDSFPGLSFPALVTSIADQAEFTPRNVQTVEGRKNTVFAVKLEVDDPADRLKAGMPADVVFK